MFTILVYNFIVKMAENEDVFLWVENYCLHRKYIVQFSI